MATSTSALQSALRKLVGGDEQGGARLDKLPPVGPRPGGVGSGRPASAGSSAGWGFVEADYAKREHYPDRAVTTPDGIFSIVWAPTKKMIGTDGSTFQLAEPPL